MLFSRVLIVILFPTLAFPAGWKGVCEKAISDLNASTRQRLALRGKAGPPLSEAVSILPPKGYSAYLSSERNFATSQIEEIADFAANLYIAYGGKAEDLPLREFQIVRKSPFDFGSSIRKQDDQLIVLPSLLTNKPVTSFELKENFDAGKHLPRNLRTAWKYLNPAGPFRVTVRQTLGEAKNRLKLAIASLPGNPLEDFVSAVSNLVDLERLSSENKEKLKSLTPLQIPALLEKWLKRIEAGKEESHLENTLAGKVSSQSSIGLGYRKDPSPNVNVFQFGLVAVGNYHDIDIRANVGGTDYSRYLAPIKPEDRPQINANVIGLITSVYTIDRVHVDAGLHLNGALEASTLDNTLTELSSPTP